jgi:hypothetical protein
MQKLGSHLCRMKQSSVRCWRVFLSSVPSMSIVKSGNRRYQAREWDELSTIMYMCLTSWFRFIRDCYRGRDSATCNATMHKWADHQQRREKNWWALLWGAFRGHHNSSNTWRRCVDCLLGCDEHYINHIHWKGHCLRLPTRLISKLMHGCM